MPAPTEADVVALLAARPDQTVLAFDFDGTLSAIVDDPEAAGPVAGAMAVLERLSTAVARVALISGRPRAFLAAHAPDGVDLSGLYGLETRIAGVERDHPDADRWRASIDDAVAAARRIDAWRDAGVVVEPKGLSLTLHFRNAPSMATAVEHWAADAAERLQLEPRTAKASIELHPHVDVDKGTSLADFADGAETVLFAGDDVGDVPAFVELRRRRVSVAEPDRSGIGIAVGGPAVPEEVRAVADLVLDAPEDLVRLLHVLADRLDA